MDIVKTNENNNINLNMIQKDSNDEKYSLVEEMVNTLCHSASELKSLIGESNDSNSNMNVFKTENSNQQLLMLQPLLNIYFQNKYVNEWFRTTQHTYFEHLSKIMQPNSIMPPQEFPLDLSLKSQKYKFCTNVPSNNCSNDFQLDQIKKEVISFGSKKHKKLIENFTNTEVLHLSTNSSSSIEASEIDTDMTNVIQNIIKYERVNFSCPICNQTFAIQDRLAKHIASCHKSKKKQTEVNKTYECEVCKRCFARSDMLTRHSRLHTGVKPYACNVCGQVFSRSDHLSTHQRTHSGEKPYKCPYPSCVYSACRRDMINRHMRTHNRNNETVKTFNNISNNGSIIFNNNNNLEFSSKGLTINQAYIKTES